jgi:hypothetical protein
VRTTASPISQPQSSGRASLTQPSDPMAPPCGLEHWNVVEDFQISSLAEPCFSSLAKPSPSLALKFAPLAFEIFLVGPW